jgi:hypothetical protein
MAEKEMPERIEGGIEAVGFYPGSDPEKIEELQAMQRMYERLADEIRSRKGVPFTKVLQQAQAKADQEKAAGSPPPGEAPPPEEGAEAPASSDETP